MVERAGGGSTRRRRLARDAGQKYGGRTVEDRRTASVRLDVQPPFLLQPRVQRGPVEALRGCGFA